MGAACGGGLDAGFEAVEAGVVLAGEEREESAGLQ